MRTCNETETSRAIANCTMASRANYWYLCRSKRGLPIRGCSSLCRLLPVSLSFIIIAPRHLCMARSHQRHLGLLMSARRLKSINCKKSVPIQSKQDLTPPIRLAWSKQYIRCENALVKPLLTSNIRTLSTPATSPSRSPRPFEAQSRPQLPDVHLLGQRIFLAKELLNPT